MIQCRRDVSHQAHEKERQLKHGFGYKVHPAHQLIVPCRCLEVDEHRGDPQEDLHSNDLAMGQLSNLGRSMVGETYRKGYEKPDQNSRAYCYGSLLIMFIFEQAGILQSSECWDILQLW